ncbi:MAG: insulinase family protein [Hydrogenophilus sp.]|nr:insulinase family protein [Hydrogenophilus sp.]
MKLRLLSFWTALLIFLSHASIVHAAPISERFVVDGVVIDLVETRTLPIIDLILSFDAGSRRDPPQQEGLASLTQALLFGGTTAREEQSLAEAIADLALQHSGAVDQDRSILRWRFLADAPIRDAALSLIAEIVATPAFPEPIVVREKNRAIAALQESLTRPEVVAERTLWSRLYPDHPYGRLPTAESLAPLTREALIAFHRRHYTRATLSIAIVGPLSRAEAEALVRPIIAALPEGIPLPPPSPPLSAPSSAPPSPIYLPHPSTQTHWLVALPLIRRDDPDYFPLLVGNWIFGGGSFSSRLVQAVREAHGLAYSVYSQLEPLADPGPWTIRFQTRGHQAETARAIVLETLTRFLSEGPSEEELRLAQTALADGWGLRLDSNRKIADWLAIVNFYRLPPDWLNRYPEAVRATTAEAIRNLFQQRIDLSALTWIAVGGNDDPR